MTAPGKPKVAVAMLGARMHYAVPRILAEAGLLSRFYTDSYVGNKPALVTGLRLMQRVTGGQLATRWLGRDAPGLPAERVTSFEALGLRYAFARRRAKDTAELKAVFAATNARFARAVLRKGLGEADTLWGFNTASVELFRAAKTDGRRCVLEQTILPNRLETLLLRDVAADWPGWQPGLGLSQDPDLLARREAEEWALADLIVAGSDFVAEGLAECGVDRARIRVIPYGIDPAAFPPPEAPRPAEGPLRLLFVGEVGLRKGVPYLLEVLRELGPEKVRARFAGRIALDPARLAPYREVAEFLGAVPRADMPDLYRWAQVFTLPSIVEGSATASYEALMACLPVIATANAGSLVRDGIDGHIVPAGDSAAIAAALNDYISEPERVVAESRNARAARESISFARYGRDLLALFE